MLMKLSELYYFAVENLKFHKPNFGDFDLVNFRNFYQAFDDLHEICSVLLGQISTRFRSY